MVGEEEEEGEEAEGEGEEGGEWTENTVSIALLTLYRGGHHSKSIFLYSILSEIPTLYIFKKNAAIFSN